MQTYLNHIPCQYHLSNHPSAYQLDKEIPFHSCIDSLPIDHYLLGLAGFGFMGSWFSVSTRWAMGFHG